MADVLRALVSGFGEVTLHPGQTWGEVRPQLAQLLCLPELTDFSVKAGRLDPELLVGESPLRDAVVLDPLGLPVAGERGGIPWRQSNRVRRIKPRRVREDLARWYQEAGFTAQSSNPSAPGSRAALTLALPAVGALTVALVVGQPLLALFSLSGVLAALPSLLVKDRPRKTVPCGSHRDLKRLRRLASSLPELPTSEWRTLTPVPTSASDPSIQTALLEELTHRWRGLTLTGTRGLAAARAIACGFLARGGQVSVTGPDQEAWGWLTPARPAGPALSIIAGCSGWGADTSVLRVCHCRGHEARRRHRFRPERHREISRSKLGHLALPFARELVRDLAAGNAKGHSLSWLLPGSGEANLPTVVPLPNPNPLNRHARNQPGTDQRSGNQPSPEWQIPLGVDVNGKVMAFDLLNDGPHLLIAGTTGSGKSQVLQALILALAGQHSPNELVLALVDFKGGASFGPCWQLPHVIGSVTDLEAGMAGRALIGLRAELDRRKRVLHGAGVADISELPPDVVPRLVVVFDEFRALTEELPDAVSQLLRLAAQGRSLGVHLILATQRATGAVGPEMAANVSARLALRVVNPTDSLDLIDSPLAAALPVIPGRAVFRVGARQPTTIQCFWADAPETQPVQHASPALTSPPIDHCGDAHRHSGLAPESRTEKLALEISRRYTGNESRQPLLWLPPLPKRIPLSALPQTDVLAQPGVQAQSGAPGASISFALADQPESQAQPAIGWDPITGPLAIVGTARTGRTTALESLGLSAVCTGWEVHFLGQLPVRSPLTEHPNFGTEVPLSDPERAGRLLSALLTPQSIGAPGQVLVLVDGMERWREIPGIPELLTRVASSAALAVTANGPNVGTWVGATNHLTLLSTDHSSDLLLGVPSQFAGRAPGPGRGFWLPASSTGTGSLLCQVAFPDSPAAAGVSQNLATGPVAAGIPAPATQTPRGFPVLRIPPLRPTRLTDLPAPQADTVWLGLGGNSAEHIALPRAPGVLITGPHGSGRTNALQVMLNQWHDDAARVAVVGQDTNLMESATAAGFTATNLFQTNWRELTTQGFVAVVVDDLDSALAWAGVEVEAALQEVWEARIALLVSCTTSAALMGNRGILAALRANRVGLVLNPATRGSDEVFHCQLPPPYPLGEPGVGWLVNGPMQPVRVALA
ncbi:MAG: FtsK/SpoIIIE domain-containing protein [Promicromonosporaceae bacterium]|nr:FtsK/SpoIIIE domain-containing protein [Promicromonosporaceae bacterium]